MLTRGVFTSLLQREFIACDKCRLSRCKGNFSTCETCDVCANLIHDQFQRRPHVRELLIELRHAHLVSQEIAREHLNDRKVAT